jgi:biotin carboxyl carrier protein
MKVKSQMPGKILKCSVLVGDLVEVGAPLLVMEAMKMENEIRAPLSGRIKSLSVSVGSLVETGSVLLEIEKA